MSSFLMSNLFAENKFNVLFRFQDGNGKQVTATLQATSLEDRKKWVSVMDGKEPEYVTTKVFPFYNCFPFFHIDLPRLS